MVNRWMLVAALLLFVTSGQKHAMPPDTDWKDLLSVWRNGLPKGDAPTPARICIVGCGIAGLTAANLLQRTGMYDITILEATDRCGGRQSTWNCGHPLHAELGAMRFACSQPLVHTMAFDMGLKMRPFKTYNPEAFYYYPEIWPTPIPQKLFDRNSPDFNMEIVRQAATYYGVTRPEEMVPPGKPL